jgi:PIN domain nuclease of toxin-antitoxin system
MTWFELAWLARHGRIRVAIPIRSWLAELSQQVRTLGITPLIAETAVSLAEPFPGDPADRLIYATAIEHGARLVTKDQRLRSEPQGVALW